VLDAIHGLMTEIHKPNHEIVDEAASEAARRFVATGQTMAAVNQDPGRGAFLGTLWDITNDQPSSP
jgi:hypothetical protein